METIRGARRPPATTLAVAGLTLVAAVCYSGISLFRHDHFGSNAYDLGIQDQTVWGYSRFQVIPNTVLGVRDLLGDHFHPILVVLAPFYWIWDTAAVLLVAQAVLLAVAGIPIFLWASERLGSWAGLAFQACYMVFWGVLAAVVFDFHHVVFAVPALAVALHGLVTRRDRWLFGGVAVALLAQEDVSLTVGAIGVYTALVQRRLLLGATLLALGVAWFATVVGVVMPALAGLPYGHWTYTQLGKGPVSALEHILLHPIDSLALLFTPGQKLEVWAGLLGNWLFLPLLSPLMIVAVPSLLARFWSSDPTFWSFHFQYSLTVAPILSFAAIDTAARIRRLESRERPWIPRWLARARAWAPTAAMAGGSLAVAAVASFAAIQPLAELGSYVSSARAAEIQSCLDVIPPTGSVAASSRLVPHLSERRQIYVLIEMWNAADMLDFEPSRLIEPGFDGHRASPSCVERNLIGSIFGCNSGRRKARLQSRRPQDPVGQVLRLSRAR